MTDTDKPEQQQQKQAQQEPQQQEPQEQGQKQKAKTLAVRYGYMQHIGEFEHYGAETLQPGTKIIVQTERGMELGQAVSYTCSTCSGVCVTQEKIEKYIDQSGQDSLKFKAGKILRTASKEDLLDAEHIKIEAEQKRRFCQELAETLGLGQMKVVSVEHIFGGERIVFYFTSNGRIDFRELVKELAHRYQTRIEMRQIGSRDEARILADYEICGRECCCKNFLKTFRPVNMKMAKLQKATLDPSKVSGRCGRLRCCLRFEHQSYEQLVSQMPKIGSVVRIQPGVGIVKDRQVLTQLVQIQLDDARRVTIPTEEILEKDLPKQALVQLNQTQQVSEQDAAETQTQEQQGRAGQPGRQRSSQARQIDKPQSQADPSTAEGSGQDGEGTAKRSQYGGRRRRRHRRRNDPAGQGPSQTPKDNKPD